MTFVKGDPRINREGRPVGTKNFSTIFDEVLEEIAKANNISHQDALKILLKKAYGEAKDGNYQYYQDLLNRYFGKAQEKMDITSGGEKISSGEDARLEKLAQMMDEKLKKEDVK